MTSNSETYKVSLVPGLGKVSNRIALAPLTRGRCIHETNLVEAHHVEYYAQRSANNGGAGLVISEGTYPHHTGIGYIGAPGIFNKKQMEAWKSVTAAVRASGSLFFCQLWHQGRASHSAFQKNGEKPLAPSELKLKGDGTFKMRVPGSTDPVEAETPKAMTLEDIEEISSAYAEAAAASIEAGFDGIELHAANGYLVDQFLQSCTNIRTDDFGGSLENRLRFLELTVDKILKVVPKEKVGVRLSPNGTFNDMGAEDNFETFNAAIELLAKKGVCYIHLIDGVFSPFHDKCEFFTLDHAMAAIKKIQGEDRITALIGNTGYFKKETEKAIAEGKADLIAIGRPFIENPDLVFRYKNELPITPHGENLSYFYVRDPEDPRKGYCDWPRATL
eukprot:augustus_masked-scaffold_31-processed-gene-2.63-mRNA-1 protein AED:0.01 eAED:0.01 QI:0/-1/0/1/-1/1/1/0/388